MQTCWFVVIRSNDKWWVDCEGKAYGPFANRDDATTEGTVLARTFGDSRRRAEVWAPDDAGRMKRLWIGAVKPI
jgi:hypothetical protein